MTAGTDTHTIYQVEVPGTIEWGPGRYRLACPDCGADRGLVLNVQQPPEVIGERAWANCSAGHRFGHPLVYPAVVRELLEWLRDPGDQDALEERLVACRWEPHAVEWSNTDGPSDTLPLVEYHPWSRWPAVRGAWEEYWPRWYPELVASMSPYS